LETIINTLLALHNLLDKLFLSIWDSQHVKFHGGFFLQWTAGPCIDTWNMMRQTQEWICLSLRPSSYSSNSASSQEITSPFLSEEKHLILITKSILYTTSRKSRKYLIAGKEQNQNSLWYLRTVRSLSVLSSYDATTRGKG